MLFFRVGEILKTAKNLPPTATLSNNFPINMICPQIPQSTTSTPASWGFADQNWLSAALGGAKWEMWVGRSGNTMNAQKQHNPDTKKAAPVGAADGSMKCSNVRQSDDGNYPPSD